MSVRWGYLEIKSFSFFVAFLKQNFQQFFFKSFLAVKRFYKDFPSVADCEAVVVQRAQQRASDCKVKVQDPRSDWELHQERHPVQDLSHVGHNLPSRPRRGEAESQSQAGRVGVHIPPTQGAASRKRPLKLEPSHTFGSQSAVVSHTHIKKILLPKENTVIVLVINHL